MRFSSGFIYPIAVLCLLAAGCSTSPEAYLEKGRKAATSGKYAEAEIDYLKAIQVKPDYGEAWYGLGTARLKESHLNDSWQALNRATELLPSREDVAVSLAEATMALYVSTPTHPPELYERLSTTAAILFKRNPNSFDGIRLKGYLAFIDRHFAEAVELLKKADSIKPGQGDVTQALMECLIQSGQGPEAEKIGTAFLARNKDFAPVYDVLYGYYHNNHQDADAERVIKSKIAVSPRDLQPRMQLAQFYLDTKNDGELSGVLKQVLDDSTDFPDGRLAIGDFYSANKLRDEALRVFQAGAAQGGKSKAIYQQRSADLLVTMGKPAEAIPVLQDILKTDPTNIPARSLRAGIRLDSGSPDDTQAAFADLTQLAQEQPRDAMTHYNLGRAWLAKGNTEAALNQFREGLRQNPQLMQARVLAADVSMRRGEYAQAREYSDQLVDETGGHPAARLLRAAALTGMGNFDEASVAVRQLTQEFPNAIEPKLQLGALRMAQKRYSDAEEIYRALHDASRQDLRPLRGLLDSMVAQEHYDTAIQLLNQEKQRPGAPVAQLDILLADTALRGRKLDVAVQQYSRLVTSKPNSAFDHLRLGDAYLQKGNTQEAVSEIETAKNLNPKDAQSNAMLGLALNKAGKDADAERAYRAALALQPENPLVKNNLAYLMAEKGGNLDDALRLAQEASRQQPDNIALADTVAFIYLKKNLPDSAIQILSNATRKDPKEPVFRYHLAMALLQKGDKSGARRECEAALAVGPGKADEAKIRALLARVS
ncbi:MAG TPA: tetratricopeptide repeat protein [Bryobacteraceae bacterium]|jgi:tetratricopeptide (TPR) repeat protein